MKTLIDKIRKVGRRVRNGVGRAILVGTAVASLGVASCKLDGPEVNYAPQISELYAQPNPVEKNKETKLNLIGTDKNGDYDIANYKLALDNNSNKMIDTGDEEIVSSPSPIVDYSKTFAASGTKTILGKVTDVSGASETKSIDVVVSETPVIDYLDVEGWLKNENNLPQKGLVKIYDSAGMIDEIQADNNGYFKKNTNKKISELVGSEVVLTAIGTDTSGNQRTYKAKERFPKGDVIANPLWVVLKEDLPTWPSPAPTEEEFKTYVNQVNASYNGLRGFDWNAIIQNGGGVEILRGDPLGRGFNLTQLDQIALEVKINDSNDIGIYVPDINLNGSTPGWINVQIDENKPLEDPNNRHYERETINNEVVIVPHVGWIIVSPWNIADSQTQFFWDFDFGKIKRARIDLGVVNDSVPTHEFGHIIIGSNPLYNGHVNITPFYYGPSPPTSLLTILTPDNLKSPPPGIADEKLAKIVGGVFRGVYQFGKPLDEILGTDAF